MEMRQLGKKGPKVSALGLGCMGMSVFYGPTDEKQALEVVEKAFESGVTFFDTADMYGNGANEILLGKGIKKFRNEVIVSTKCGIVWDGVQVTVNNHPEYIREACHASLKRLGRDTIDLYFLHRYNPSIPLEKSMPAMLKLIDEGKIRFIGFSEVDGEVLEKAHQILGDKLVALQSEYSIVNHTDTETVLATCRKLQIGIVAHAPLARGLLGGKLKDASLFTKGETWDVRSISPQFHSGTFEHNLRLVNALDEIAKKKHCTVAQLCLAWLLAQGKDVVPIPGTKRLDYLNENLGALKISLSLQDLKDIAKAIKDHPIQGLRLI